MPPEYTSNPPIPPRFGAGGGDATTLRQKAKTLRTHPYGRVCQRREATAASAEPQTSARLNRGQPFHKKVGPSGKEWIEGDNAWLDACTCTTGCNCRKSHRVLYRAQNDPQHHGSDSNEDEQDHLRTSGEIRYILKTDLGRDCGDHTACKKSSSESDSSSSKDEKSKRRKKKTKRKSDEKEDKKRKDQFDTLKDDILEALQDLRKDGRQQQQRRQRDSSESPARQPFGGPNMGQSAFMMNNGGGGMDMDPRMAQQMGMMSGDPYGTTGRMPPGMADPTVTGGKRGMMHHGMGGMGMGMGMGGGIENDMLSEMDDMGLNMNMGNPYMQSAGGGLLGKNGGMRHPFLSHRGAAKAGRQFGNGGMGMGMDMDMDQMAAMYAKAMGSGRRGGMMMGGGRNRGGGGRRVHLDTSSDEFDLGPGPSMRSSGIRHEQGGGGGGGAGGIRDRAGK
ncbi:hypothetical protein J4E86_008738 [Alternaria arbusti]|uniref:uncharacterized protein n=1 Tax=Alternaria arbusti TaxID=232088 RepID=UPI00221FB2EC|nr:uncharacterized protein J4E86_008738 [Alternaria arbusti]KAI4947114.1 hypothetical protein J4E86_008738 [Alternaria arbusti]